MRFFLRVQVNIEIERGKILEVEFEYGKNLEVFPIYLTPDSPYSFKGFCHGGAQTLRGGPPPKVDFQISHESLRTEFHRKRPRICAN